MKLGKNLEEQNMSARRSIHKETNHEITRMVEEKSMLQQIADISNDEDERCDESNEEDFPEEPQNLENSQKLKNDNEISNSSLKFPKKQMEGNKSKLTPHNKTSNSPKALNRGNMLLKNLPETSSKKEPSKTDKISDANFKMIFYCCLFLVFGVCLGYIGLSFASLPKLHEERKTCKFNRLIKRYPLESNELWETLKYGIEDILNLKNPDGPSVYLFMRNKNSAAPNFVEDIAYLTSACFGSELEPITLTEKDFDKDDYGIAIAKYKKDIHEGGVLVVTVNLNEVPGEAARALHTICDKFSPIVKKVVIFLSLVIDPKSEGVPLQIAETTLRNIWQSSLNKNELDPLIVRVSDTVFRLKS